MLCVVLDSVLCVVLEPVLCVVLEPVLCVVLEPRARFASPARFARVARFARQIARFARFLQRTKNLRTCPRTSKVRIAVFRPFLKDNRDNSENS